VRDNPKGVIAVGTKNVDKENSFFTATFFRIRKANDTVWVTRMQILHSIVHDGGQLRSEIKGM